MKYKKIALIGMMGSGKTTIAGELSKKTALECFDTDEIFEKKFSIKIADFFKKYGEDAFRDEENKILSDISKKNNFILSLGGGVVVRAENRKIIFNEDIFSIYLEASPDTIYERIKNDRTRPLLLVENPKSKIDEIIKSRLDYYKMASVIIDTNFKTTDEITGEIIKIL